jgi:AraC family transcriptional regulator of adaptative response / methylphosphotriester-DNA alkyltransferase methyltransferase
MKRPEEITANFLFELDKHIADIVSGKQDVFNEIKKLLASSELTITQIAYRLTYDSASFTRFFKKYVGQTPSSFRAQSRLILT